MIYQKDSVPPEIQEQPAEMTARDAYMLAMQMADDLVSKGQVQDWETAFKKNLQAAILQVPGKQTINAKG